MPLTPQDVQNKLFSAVRFTRGYDENEVDAFLDEVESELRRLYAEIDALRAAQITQAEDGPAARASSAVTAVTAVTAPSGAPETRSAADPLFGEQEVADPVVTRGPASPPTPTSVPPVSSDPVVSALAAPRAVPAIAAPVPDLAALPEPSPTEEALRRTLVLAQRTADAAIAEARAEASALVSEAREQAAATERGAAAEFAARQRERQAEQEALMAAVEHLRAFEREYRGRLRAYLHLQLRDLDTQAPAEPVVLRGTSSREAISTVPHGEIDGEKSAVSEVAPEPDELLVWEDGMAAADIYPEFSMTSSATRDGVDAVHGDAELDVTVDETAGDLDVADTGEIATHDH